MTQKKDKLTYFFPILFIAFSVIGIGFGILALLRGDILFSITFFGLGILLFICGTNLFKLLYFEIEKAVSK